MDLTGREFQRGFNAALDHVADWHVAQNQKSTSADHYYSSVEIRKMKETGAWFRSFHVGLATLGMGEDFDIQDTVRHVMTSYYNVVVIFASVLVLHGGATASVAVAAMVFAATWLGYGRRWLSLFGVCLGLSAIVAVVMPRFDLLAQF